VVQKNSGICDSDKLAAEEAAAKKAAEEKAARDLGLFLSFAFTDLVFLYRQCL